MMAMAYLTIIYHGYHFQIKPFQTFSQSEYSNIQLKKVIIINNNNNNNNNNNILTGSPCHICVFQWGPVK